MAETQQLLLMTKDGPSMHRDLCHMARHLQMKEMDSIKLSSMAAGSAEQHQPSKACNVFIYVSRAAACHAAERQERRRVCTCGSAQRGSALLPVGRT